MGVNVRPCGPSWSRDVKIPWGVSEPVIVREGSSETVSDRPTDPAEYTSLPLIGDRAPDFEAESTHGPVRLTDYSGRWLVLFSHPADFTPVCTAGFVAFTELADEFAARNTALLGNSVDVSPEVWRPGGQARVRNSFSSSASLSAGLCPRCRSVRHWRMPPANIEAGPVQGVGDRGRLGDDVLAVPLRLDHGDDRGQLSLGLPEPVEHLGPRVRFLVHEVHDISHGLCPVRHRTPPGVGFVGGSGGAATRRAAMARCRCYGRCAHLWGGGPPVRFPRWTGPIRRSSGSVFARRCAACTS